MPRRTMARSGTWCLAAAHVYVWSVVRCTALPPCPPRLPPFEFAVCVGGVLLGAANLNGMHAFVGLVCTICDVRYFSSFSAIAWRCSAAAPSNEQIAAHRSSLIAHHTEKGSVIRDTQHSTQLERIPSQRVAMASRHNLPRYTAHACPAS